MKLKLILSLLLFSSLASAQITKTGVNVQNGSSSVGHANTVNCDGTTMTCSISGSVVTLSSLGGGNGSSLWEANNVGIDTFNNVGIGTTAPQYKLDVRGNVGIGTPASPVQFFNVYTQSPPIFSSPSGIAVNQIIGINDGAEYTFTDNAGDMYYGDISNAYGDRFLQFDIDGNLFVDSGDPPSVVQRSILQDSNGNMGIGTTIANSRLIVKGGNVGIGTDVPGQVLDVTGTVRATNFSGLGSSLTNISLTTGVTGTLPIANGGTNASTSVGVAANIGVVNMALLPTGIGNSYVDPLNTIPNFKGQVGFSEFGSNQPIFYWPASTTQGDYSHAISFGGGVSLVGSTPFTGIKMDHLFNSNWIFNADPVGMESNGDSVWALSNYSNGFSNSGGGICLSDMSDINGIAVDTADNGLCLEQVQGNRIQQLIPAWSYWVANSDSTNAKGFAFTWPGWGNVGDSGNYSALMMDSVNNLVRFPHTTSGSYQPDDNGSVHTIALGSSGGTGLSVNDVCEISQGGATFPAFIKVTAVSGGVATAISQDTNESNVKNSGFGRGYSLANGLSTICGEMFTIAINAPGIGYKPQDTITVTQSGGSSATAVVSSTNGGIATIAVGSSGGSLYQVGDVLTPTQAAYGSTVTWTPAGGLITVTSLSGSAVNGVSITGPGAFYFSANNLPVTGGHGTGCTLNITAGKVTSLHVMNRGSGYHTASGLTTTGGNGTGLTVNLTSPSTAGSAGPTVNITAINNWRDTFVIDSNNGTMYQGKTNATDNFPFGFNSLSAVTTGSQLYAMGFDALQFNTTGSNNIAYGFGALQHNTQESDNIAIGVASMQAESNAANNGQSVAIGSSSMASNTSNALFDVTCVGYQCMKDSTSIGNYNTCIGATCLKPVTGSANAALGIAAGSHLTSGSNNVSLGPNTLSSTITSGSDNIIIGDTINVPAAATSNFVDIGNVLFATGTTTGTASSALANVGIGTILPNATLDVEGTVSPVSFFAAVPSSGVNQNVGIGTFSPGQKLDIQGTVRVSLLGGTLAIASGTNGCQGQATLASGTVTVSTTCTPITSQGIFLQDATTGTLTNVGTPTVGTITSATSFVINSTNVLDTSKVNWWILKAS